MRVELDDGSAIDLGLTETSPTISIVDYSRRVTDDFGVTTVVERGFARRLSVRLGLPFDTVDGIQQRLAALRATAALWVADDRYESLRVRGFYKDFSLDLATPPLSYCTLTIEGLAETPVLPDVGGDPAPAGLRSTLQVLQPVDVTDAVLAASTVAEADHPEWSVLTSYAIGARVLRGATHRIYESVAGDNVGDDPLAASGKWLDVGPTNRWAMFDQALGTSTSAVGSIDIVLNDAMMPADAVALLDVIGSTVRVIACGYDRTVPVGAGPITFLDLPSQHDGRIRIIISGPAQVSVGTLLAGRIVAIGVTEASPTASISDFSRKEVDDFGDVIIVERAWAKRMQASALIRSDAVDAVISRVSAVRARPCLWIGQAGVGSLTVYGFFKDFSVSVGESVSKVSLSIEGLSAAAPIAPLGAGINWPDIADPNGTKPADNADKTGDNTSKDTANVGGRPAAGVLAAIGGNTFNQALAAAEGELARIRTRALNFPGPEGEDSYTLLRRETTQRKAADGVFAETFELLGARTPNGTSFVLNTSTVRISDEESLAQRFDAILARFGDNEASIEHIDQVLVGPDGASARALVTVDVNGRIIGTALTNDGSEGAFVISADNVRIEDPDTGQPYFYADDTGKVLMHDVEVDTIRVGAVHYDTMQLGAAQKTAWVTLPNNFTVPRGQTPAVFTLPFVKEDTSSVLEIQVFMNARSVDDLQFDVTIQIDGMVMLGVPGVNLILDNQNSQAQAPVTPFCFAGGIAAGARTITVKVYNREADAGADLTIQAGSTLKVNELRKASIGSLDGSGGAIPPAGGGGDAGGGSGGGSGGGGYEGGYEQPIPNDQ